MEPPSLSASQDEAAHEERQRKLSFSSSCSSVPDPQKCIPSEKVIFDCILKEYNGVVSFAVISSRQDLFPNGCGDITAWFKARKDSFLLSESKEGKILEVSAFCRRVQLCFNQACQRKDCPFLHVCRDYIAGFCRFGDGCQRNHCFQFNKDRKFLSKLRLNGLTEENLRKVIQLSIPQVCLDYNEGYCARGQSCTQIHICKDMIRKKCEDEEYCGLQHQSALLTAQATAILQNYGLPRIRDGNVNPVLRVLLVCENKLVVLKITESAPFQQQHIRCS
ncbi:Poly (ADP-ribose) polymerase [Desmophyllum pertusum]|uniref:Poly (ADP-ribose) polymerase n=1 Tax=Desmophyllum pertusum TaxID=174260 RepID=A0A9W9YES0_9CNID|nr:Poly (ADP-ribose) polymerase [Desmophyllum pertusum]